MARQDKRVVQTRLGKQDIAADKVIYFPRGLMGFEEQKEFTLLQIRDDSPFLVLQSMTDPRLGLLVADPYMFLDDFPIRVGEAEQKLLKLQNIRQVAVLVTVTIPPGHPERTAMNLSGPILVNHESRIGLQVPQVDGKFPSQVYLHGNPDEKATEESAEKKDEA